MTVEHYPVNLVVRGRRCLVVGGGEVGTHKAAGLAEAGARVSVVAPVVSARVWELPGVEVRERPYERGDLDGMRLAFTTTDDPVVNARVFADAEAAGIWVCSADDPANCSFTLPSVLRRGSFQLAVSTGGRSPAFSAWMRQRLEDEIGAEYGVLVDLLAEERDRLRAEGRSTMGLDWRKALDGDMLVLIRNGRIDQAREHLHTCLS